MSSSPNVPLEWEKLEFRHNICILRAEGEWKTCHTNSYQLTECMIEVASISRDADFVGRQASDQYAGSGVHVRRA